MFRYCAMALEADFDEFGYTDASDIEIESEILELGDDYEAPEPEFQRQVQAEFREVPPRSVPRSHPAVLSADTLPPPPVGVEGLMGLPPAAALPAALGVEKPAIQGSQPAPSLHRAAPATRVAKSSRTSAAEVPAKTVAKTVDKTLSAPKAKAETTPKSVSPSPEIARAETPRKTPAKEQIAPLAGSPAGKAVTKPGKSSVIASKPSGRNGKESPAPKETLQKPVVRSTKSKPPAASRVGRKEKSTGNGAPTATVVSPKKSASRTSTPPAPSPRARAAAPKATSKPATPGRAKAGVQAAKTQSPAKSIPKVVSTKTAAAPKTASKPPAKSKPVPAGKPAAKKPSGKSPATTRAKKR